MQVSGSWHILLKTHPFLNRPLAMNLHSLHPLLREELFQPESALVRTRIQRWLSRALLLPWRDTGIFASEPLLTSCVHLLSMGRPSSLSMATCPNTSFARLHGNDRGANDLLAQIKCTHTSFCHDAWASGFWKFSCELTYGSTQNAGTKLLEPETDLDSSLVQTSYEPPRRW